MRGDTLACVAHVGVYKERLERIGARTACAVSALDRNLYYFKVWVDEFARACLGE